MTTALNYDELYNEITEKLTALPLITLATCAGDKITARSVAPINDGVTAMVATNVHSEKVLQMKQNPKVALAADNIKKDGHQHFSKKQ